MRLTWFFLIFFGGIQQATGVLPPQIGLAQIAPGAAALMMLVIFRKDRFQITFFSKDTPALRYLWAALIPVGVGLVVYLVQSLVPMEPTAVPDVYNQMLLVMLWIPIGALGEELGWRGYLNKLLDKRLRGLFSAVLVGLMWLPIHISFLNQGPIILFFLALWFISLSIVIHALVQDTGFSVLVAAIFHLSINLINLLVLDVMFSVPYWVINGTVWAVAALVVVLAKRDLFLGRKSPKEGG